MIGQDSASAKELKINLKEALKKSGVLKNVKAQIRKEFINNLADRGGAKPFAKIELQLSLKSRIILSLVYNFLRQKLYMHTLSVFAAEIGVEIQSMLSEAEIVEALHFGSASAAYTSFLSNESNNLAQQSLLELVVEDVGTKALRGLHEACTQTDANGSTFRDYLDDNIRLLQNSFLSRRDYERMNPNRTLEERMILFQRDCEERYKRELTIQLSYIRDNEIAKMRLEENRNSRIALENMRKEMEFDYQKKIEILSGQQ